MFGGRTTDQSIQNQPEATTILAPSEEDDNHGFSSKYCVPIQDTSKDSELLNELDEESSQEQEFQDDNSKGTEEKELDTSNRKRKSTDEEENEKVSYSRPKRNIKAVKLLSNEQQEEDEKRKDDQKKAHPKQKESKDSKKRKSLRKKAEPSYLEFEETMDEEFQTVKPVRKPKVHRIEWPQDPLPPAEKLPDFPNTGKCEWTFQEKSRVVLAKFLTDDIDDEDRNFLLHMMERTDIALVSEGLYKEKHQKCWDLEYMKHRAGNQISHRIRRFKLVNRSAAELYKSRFDVDPKNGVIDKETESFMTAIEQNQDTSMRISDYIKYIQEWEALSQNRHEKDKTNIFRTSSGDQYDLTEDRLYLIDFDFKKMLPESYESFRNKFMLPEVLPGGDYCLMRSVTPEAQPFMGPNLYLTPPGSYTHFHQDGHGTVDSGHLCLRGYNEVVMLRRMDEIHKQHALHLLTGSDRRRNPIHYDGLYGLPHSDGMKPEWADHEAIRACEKMNYYPCVFILEPGQLLHIGKARLHAFRKLTCDTLEPNDCHHDIRKELIRQRNIHHDPLCFSIAWDWMFMGHTQVGMKNEVQVVLDCEKLAFQNAVRSLATPDLCLIEMAKEEIARLESLPKQGRLSSKHFENLIGIGPFVCSSLRKQIKLIKDMRTNRKLDAQVFDVPDSQRKDSSIDAYGNDYFCKICQRELSNIYFHCEGCENLLAKDFNVCPDCYSDRSKIDINFQMHPHRPMKDTKGHRADYNHLGKGRRDFTARKKCGCKNGPACSTCKYQICCSCRCHLTYSMRLRLNSLQDLCELLKEIESYCNGNMLIDEQSDSNHDNFSTCAESEVKSVDSVEQNQHTIHSFQTVVLKIGNCSETIEVVDLSKSSKHDKRRRSVVTDVRYASPSPESSPTPEPSSSPASEPGSPVVTLPMLSSVSMEI